MRRKTGLNIERHQAIGMDLARISDRLVTLGCEVANVYPATSAVGRLAAGLASAPVKVLDLLRGELEDHMFAEHDGDPRASVEVYWPPREARRSGDATWSLERRRASRLVGPAR